MIAEIIRAEVLCYLLVKTQFNNNCSIMHIHVLKVSVNTRMCSGK